jgi:hypothetical protein
VVLAPATPACAAGRRLADGQEALNTAAALAIDRRLDHGTGRPETGDEVEAGDDTIWLILFGEDVRTWSGADDGPSRGWRDENGTRAYHAVVPFPRQPSRSSHTGLVRGQANRAGGSSR